MRCFRCSRACRCLPRGQALFLGGGFTPLVTKLQFGNAITRETLFRRSRVSPKLPSPLDPPVAERNEVSRIRALPNWSLVTGRTILDSKADPVLPPMHMQPPLRVAPFRAFALHAHHHFLERDIHRDARYAPGCPDAQQLFQCFDFHPAIIPLHCSFRPHRKVSKAKKRD